LIVRLNTRHEPGDTSSSRGYAVTMTKINTLLIFVFLFACFGQSANRGSHAETLTMLILGDSLTSGYGLDPQHAFPAQLEKKLQSLGRNVSVRNGGVAGDTSAGGRARLEWALSDKPDAVMVELGANDGLRGLEPSQLRENLAAIITVLKKRGIGVLLAGMLAPPNFGERYSREFNQVYPDLAKSHGVEFYPFFLDGVAAQQALNQKDGIHPNSSGVAIIVDRMLPYVLRFLDKLEKK
jgi:acyl-CoA thioesterase-1